MGAAALTLSQGCLQCVATAPHVALAAATRAIQRPKSFRKELARTREPKGRYEAVPVSKLFQPTVGQQCANDDPSQVLRVVRLGRIEFVLSGVRGDLVLKVAYHWKQKILEDVAGQVVRIVGSRSV